MTDRDPVTVIPLHRDDPLSCLLIPAMKIRILKFTQEHGDPELAQETANRFHAAFGAGSDEVFALALIDEEKQLRGHLLAGIETFMGQKIAMVYAWEKDHDVRPDTQVTKFCAQLVDVWACSHRVRRIRALAEDAARARLFQQVGYEKGPLLVSRELSYG